MNIFRMKKPSPDPRSQFKLGIESKVVARPQRKAWSCVSIVCTPTACAAIQAFTKQRWLSAQAPRLPVRPAMRSNASATTNTSTTAAASRGDTLIETAYRAFTTPRNGGRRAEVADRRISKPE